MLDMRWNRERLALVSRVVLSVIAFAAVAAAVRLSSAGSAEPEVIASVALGLALAAVVLLARDELVKWLAAEAILLSLVLATVEVAIAAARPHTWTQDPTARLILERQRAALASAVEFDTRSTSEVVATLRSGGIDALPGIARGWPKLEAVAPHLPSGFYPLSHAANSTIVECNESGQYLVYETDELGFNNPRGLVTSGRVDIAVVGESHGLGYCVPRGLSIVDVIRDAYSRTANFAFAYSGSLSQLGSFREYVEPLQPPVVLWLVNPGLAAAEMEADSPTLVNYLDESFSQGLIGRQHEVDAPVRRFAIPIQQATDAQVYAEVERARAERFAEVHKLPRIRRALTFWGGGAPEKPDLGAFEQVMRIAQRAVDRWEGALLVVVLPQYADIVGGEAPDAQRYESVMQIVRKLGLRVVDGAALFRAAPDPAGLFALRIGNHPNPSGHSLLARRVVDELRNLPQVNSSESSHD